MTAPTFVNWFACVLLAAIMVSPGVSSEIERPSAPSIILPLTHISVQRAPRLARAKGHWITTLTSFPEQIEGAAVALGRDGNVYVFGGVNANGDQSETYIYHPQTNNWTLGMPMPTPRDGAAAVTLPNGTIAVLGGGAGCFNHVNFGELCHFGTVYNQVLAYSPRTNSWTELAPMLTPRYRFAAISYHRRIYAIGGADGNKVLRSVEAYDPHRDRWSAAASLPRPEMMTAVAAAKGSIDVIGGTDGEGQTFGSLFLYNGHSWRWGAGLPQVTAGATAALGTDGQIYVIGGQTSSGYLATTQIYNPSIQEWTMGPPTPSPRSLCGGVADRFGHVYVIGGAPWETVGQQVVIYATPGSVPIGSPLYNA